MSEVLGTRARVPLPARGANIDHIPWPFAQWGLDLISPFSMAKGEVKFVIIVVDYFKKWAESEALATIMAQVITKFLWKSVVCWFGIPQNFISDNG